MPLANLTQQRLGIAAFHAKIGLLGWTIFDHARCNKHLTADEPLMMQIVDHGGDVDRVKHGRVDQESKYRLPEVVVVKTFAQPCFANCVGKTGVTAKAVNLSPANRGFDAEIARCLQEMVGHALGERDGQLGRGTNVAALSNVDEPILLFDAFLRRSLEPYRVHEFRHVILRDQMPGQRCKLPPIVVGSWLPLFHVPNPLWPTESQSCQTVDESIAELRFGLSYRATTVD